MSKNAAHITSEGITRERIPSARVTSEAFDVFNGDADGLCALLQWRLVHPCPSAVLISGPKRDTALLERIQPARGAQLVVMDIGLDANAAALERHLAKGCRVLYADHHQAPPVASAEGLTLLHDTDPKLCTSLLIDRHLEGKARAWAAVGAFGDNLREVGRQVASAAGWHGAACAWLEELGTLLNYNAYGAHLHELWVQPQALFRMLLATKTPLACAAWPAIERLKEGLALDLRRAEAEVSRDFEGEHGAIYRFPRAAWARRVQACWVNRECWRQPSRALATLTPNVGGSSWRVSVRAPVVHPYGAGAFCARFPSGGGRHAAGGITHLDDEQRPTFVRAFQQSFGSLGSLTGSRGDRS